MRIQSRTSVVTALVLALACPSATAADPVTTLAGGVAVTNTVDSIKSSIIELIRQLESSIGVSSFRTRQDLAFLLGELDYFANQHRDKIVRDLSKTEKDFLTDARNLVIVTSKEAQGSIREAGKVTETLESGIASLPFADSSPRVRRSTPEYVLNEANREKITLAVSGNLFGNAENAEMKVGDAVCSEVGKTDTMLTFLCPGKSFRAGKAIGSASANLTFFIDEPWYVDFWKWLTGGQQQTKKYQILTYVIPEVMGSFSLLGIVDEDVEINEDVTRVMEASNEHCDGERTHGPFRFSPKAGWKMRPQTVRVGDEFSGNRERSYQGPFELTETGFYYNIKLQNGGSCSPSIFGIRSKDARAWAGWRVHWTEFTTEVREKPAEAITGALKWGQDLSIELPPRTRRFTLTVNQLDGERKVITSDDDSPEWFTTQTDSTRRTLVIKPRTLADALKGT